METIAIICSSKDSAGINIRENLVDIFHFVKTNWTFDNNSVFENLEIKGKNIRIYTTNSELISSEDIDKKIEADTFIFASKHRSKENTPSFAVHSIGNWSSNELGGKEKTLCHTSAVLLNSFFLEMNKNAKETGFEITMEATHHGPYVEKPAVFVEIGSTEKEWSDSRNGEIAAKTIMSALSSEIKNCRVAVGFGGPHYCNNFNKIALKSDIAFSFICPKFNLNKIDETFLMQAIDKTKEKIDFFILDWKGLGEEKQRIIELLKNMNLDFRRADKI